MFRILIMLCVFQINGWSQDDGEVMLGDISSFAKIKGITSDGIGPDLSKEEFVGVISGSKINSIEFESPAGMTDGYKFKILRVQKKNEIIYYIVKSGGIAGLTTSYGPYHFDSVKKEITLLIE